MPSHSLRRWAADRYGANPLQALAMLRAFPWPDTRPAGRVICPLPHPMSSTWSLSPIDAAARSGWLKPLFMAS
jgi:hypothetical protein